MADNQKQFVLERRTRAARYLREVFGDQMVPQEFDLVGWNTQSGAITMKANAHSYTKKADDARAMAMVEHPKDIYVTRAGYFVTFVGV